MPKIDAPSVAEHRARVRESLVDAAEALLREHPDQTLTASAVSAAAGIARNSIYRYVESVDDLRALVVDRHLPGWVDAVAAALDGLPADEQVPAWVQANLAQTSRVGHRWLMGLARTDTPSPAVDAIAARAHAGVLDPLVTAWRELLGPDHDRLGVAVALTTGLLDAGFRQLDAGVPLDVVAPLTVDAARATTHALAQGEHASRHEH